MTTDRDRAQAALDAMNRAEKLLHEARTATDEDERRMLGMKFLVAAAEVDADALGNVWRIVSRGEVLHDTRAAGYGSASLALRDALNHDTGEDAQEGPYTVYVRGAVVATHDDRESAEQAFRVAEAAFVEALVGAGWNRTAAEDEAEIVMSIGIGNPST